MKCFLVIFLFVVMFLNHKITAQPTVGLIAHYSFSGNANDVSGNSYNGTVHGATLTSDEYGHPNSAYLFNGTNAYIDIPVSPFLLNNYSYSVCLKPTSLPPSASSMVFISIGSTGGDQYIQLANEPSLSQIGFTSGSYFGLSLPNLISVGTLPAANTYYHIVVTRSNTTYKLFINSILINSISSSSLPPFYGSLPKANIGRRTDGTFYFHGVIDDVCIYNRALNDTEITSFCNCLSSVDLGHDTTVCAGNSFTLDAGNQSATYTWYWNGNVIPNDTIQTCDPQQSGIYSVVLNNGSCSRTDSVNITIPDFSNMVISSNSPVCELDTLFLSVSPIPNGTYQWSGPNGFQSSFQSPSLINFTSIDTGIYSLVVHENGCASNQFDLHVDLANVPVPIISNADSPCLGDTLFLTSPAISNATYNWTGPNGFNSQLQNPIISNFTYLDTGTYSLTVQVDGCFSDPSFLHANNVITSLENFPIPNVFSPNGDYKNDFYLMDGLQDFEMKIFNRWGEKIIDLSPSKRKWDGTCMNQQVPEGLYFYLINSKNCKGETLTFKGTITLFR